MGGVKRLVDTETSKDRNRNGLRERRGWWGRKKEREREREREKE